MEAKFKEKNELPVITRKFKSVAEAVRNRLQRDFDNGVGPVVNRDYVQALDNWLIPFFGNHNVDTIEHRHIKAFYDYREKKLGREPARSTINTHATGMSHVFDEAVAHGYMSQFKVPGVKLNRRSGKNGKKAGRRPDFTIEEYRQLYRYMRTWVKQGKKGKPTDMRYQQRDYVLFLANTGIRHGTESYSLKWNQLELVIDQRNGEEKELLYFSVDGKVGQRSGWARAGAKRYLERILARTEDMQGLAFEEALKLDKHVFRLPDGTRTKSLDQTFRALLREIGMYWCH